MQATEIAQESVLVVQVAKATLGAAQAARTRRFYSEITFGKSDWQQWPDRWQLHQVTSSSRRSSRWNWLHS